MRELFQKLRLQAGQVKKLKFKGKLCFPASWGRTLSSGLWGGQSSV